MDSEKVKELLESCCDFLEDLKTIIKQKNARIAELESENERLNNEKEKVLAYMKTDNYAKLKKEDMYWGYQMAIGMLETEIDRQKDRIAELEEDKEKWQRKAINYYQVAKSYGIECIIDNDIDETLKELKDERRIKTVCRKVERET